jgi:fluoride exporter
LDVESCVGACYVNANLVYGCIILAIPRAGAGAFTNRERSVLGRHGVTYLLIGVGGFLGANARYLVAGWITERLGIAFPYGTLIINVSGSFILGFFLESISDRLFLHPNWRLFFAIGFLGAYTTFSTFSFESLVLLQEGSYFLASANMVGSVVLGLIAALAGMIISRLL